MDTEKAYNLGLDYLYSYIDYSRKPVSDLIKAEFNLARMRALMAEIGEPEAKYPIIHVAGTKGKGSVSVMAASALQAAGYKTGLYTSPHLWDFCERIQVNGQPISHGDLTVLVDEIKPAVARVPRLTTYEITTALGFLYFARQGCEAAVIEVGLGGRLDATNIVTPRVSVITSLSYDHTLLLGDTLAEIAGEKAGIIKPGVGVVAAPQKDEALKVLEMTALEAGCDFSLVGRDITCRSLSHSLDGQTLQVQAPNLPPLKIRIPLLGEHQIENAAVAYAALKTSGFNVPDEAIQKGFASAKWRGRFEIARRDPPVIFETAHNQDSFARMCQTLNTYFPEHQVTLILGASEDKNLQGMFVEMKSKIKKLVVTRADHPRALEPEKICRVAEQVGIKFEALEPVERALHRALELSEKDGSIVLSAGSMFVTAEVVTAWDKLNSPIEING
ncbi:MAG: folylpolyglutamate synthase/dihydrofolate synthase family protein [Anaerolineae bacterium]|nr:folylpolyglutamate synthase/dihydrofolate synthase family protein [Anaerolineae bacterium]MDK1117246.1 folylpolyglutamate synthase/dihydrofolate synthase family protein [Anaerolineae bacterium]